MHTFDSSIVVRIRRIHQSVPSDDVNITSRGPFATEKCAVTADRRFLPAAFVRLSLEYAVPNRSGD